MLLVAASLIFFSACSSPESPQSSAPTDPESKTQAETSAPTREPATVYRTTVPEPRDTLVPPTTRQAEGASAAQSSGGRLRITFLDVGQGSGMLIRLPNGGNVLIDGGPREQGGEVVANLGRLGVDTLKP